MNNNNKHDMNNVIIKLFITSFEIDRMIKRRIVRNVLPSSKDQESTELLIVVNSNLQSTIIDLKYKARYSAWKSVITETVALVHPFSRVIV